MKKSLKLLLKLMVTAGLFGLLFHQVPMAEVKEKFVNIDMFYVVLGLSAYTLSTFVSALRWCHIARSLNVDLPYAKSLKLYYLGSFFNQLLPSGMGGDAVKAVALAKTSTHKTKAVHSVILERLAGLGVLLLLVAVFSLYIVSVLPALSALLWPLLALAFCGFVVLIYVMNKPERLPQIKALSFVRKFLEDVRLSFFSSVRGFVFQFLSSLVVQMLSILVLYAAALSIGISISFMAVCALAPMLFLLLVLPISLAGWGLREGVAVSLFASAGLMTSVDALSMSLIFGVLVMLASLPGGLVLWMRYKH